MLALRNFPEARMVVIVMALRLALMECLARNLKILYCLQWRAICGRSQPHPFQHSCAWALSLLCMRASVCSCIWSYSSSYFILAGQHEHRTSVLPRRKSSTFLRMKTFGVDGVSSMGVRQTGHVVISWRMQPWQKLCAQGMMKTASLKIAKEPNKKAMADIGSKP